MQRPGPMTTVHGLYTVYGGAGDVYHILILRARRGGALGAAMPHAAAPMAGTPGARR